MEEKRLEDLRCLYFIGIGGIGMSALARYFLQRGAAIYGYDKTSTLLTRKLEEEGMVIHYEASVEELPDQIDLVVYTPAIPADHAELVYFQQNNYTVLKRAEVLGLISRNLKTIAVAGTHGKTTTSSILTHVLRTGGVDCTAFLGGISRDIGSNYVGGESEWMVVEADEYDRSFLQLTPDIAVVLSMDPDHLDIYGAHEQMKESFVAFVRQIKEGGQVFVQVDLPLNEERQKRFGLERGDYYAVNYRVEQGGSVFDFRSPLGTILNVQFTQPGRYNVENACAAIAVALQLNVMPSAIKKALASFKGIKRRFETVFTSDEVVYIDDYAHHPTELKAAIGATRQLFAERKITGIFQPHLYSRTRDFADGFAQALDLLDEVLLMGIYPAREQPIPGISSAVIFDKMTLKDRQLVDKDNLMEVLEQKDVDVLLTLGAGDIDVFVEPIKRMLEKRS